MHIEMMALENIIPYKDNPRLNGEAVQYVKESIKEFGFKVPIIVDKNHVIVAGHTRLKAAQLLGLKEAPTISADDLNAEQVKAFRLADNKVSEFSEWDFDKLKKELEKIEDIDMSEFGIREVESDFYDSEEITDPDSLLAEYEEPKNKQCTCPKCGYTADAKEFAV